MNFRIVETSNDHPDLLLFVDFDEDGDSDCVTIHTIGERAVDEEGIVQANVLFPSREMCQQFVKDYSAESANMFCKEYDVWVTYPEETEN